VGGLEEMSEGGVRFEGSLDWRQEAQHVGSNWKPTPTSWVLSCRQLRLVLYSSLVKGRPHAGPNPEVEHVRGAYAFGHAPGPYLRWSTPPSGGGLARLGDEEGALRVATISEDVKEQDGAGHDV
jgi:hypothetical protein